jgi:nucleotide-binding universal stress UspA family protein
MHDAALVPTDGNDGVDRTLDHVIEMARTHDAAVHALYVIDRRFEPATEKDREELIERLSERGDPAVEAAARCEAVGIDAVTDVQGGSF